MSCQFSSKFLSRVLALFYLTSFPLEICFFHICLLTYIQKIYMLPPSMIFSIFFFIHIEVSSNFIGIVGWFVPHTIFLFGHFETFIIYLNFFFCFNLHIILLIDLFVHLIIFYVFLAPEYTWLAYNWFFKVNLGTNLKNIGNLPVNWRTLKILVVYTDMTCSCAKKYHTNAFKGPKKSWMKISVRIEKI